MTREEALKELNQLSRAVKAGPISQPEVLCPEMKAAARILSIVLERVRKRDPLYGTSEEPELCHLSFAKTSSRPVFHAAIRS